MFMDYRVFEDEFTVGSLIRLYVSQWRTFAFLGIFLSAISVLIYIFFVSYTASAKVVINDSQNSSLHAFSNQFFGYSKSLQEGRKGHGLISKHLEYLKTREFFDLFLKKIQDRGQSPLITLQEKQGYDLFVQKYAHIIQDVSEKNDVLQLLDRTLKVEMRSDFEISVTAIAQSKSMALFLANAASELIVETLRNREKQELGRVEDFIGKQREEAEQNLRAVEEQLTQEQIQNEGILPASTQEKMGEYVSELTVRANELELQIAENKKTMAYLSQGRAKGEESSLYGLGGQIEKLNIENTLLSEKLRGTRAALKRVKRDVKILPLASLRAEELRKKADLEFARYKELNSTLGKLEAQKISVDSKFQLLEKAHLEGVAPQVSVTNLVFLAVIFAQLLGLIVIYFKFIWNPDIVGRGENDSYRDLPLSFDEKDFSLGTQINEGGYSERQIAQ